MKTDKIKSSVEQIRMSEQTKKEILDECMEYSDNPQEYESNRADYARPKRFSAALEIAACLVICGGVTGGYYALSHSTENSEANVASESEISEVSGESDFAEAIGKGDESKFETDEWTIDFNEVFNNDFNVGYFDGEKAECYQIDESTKKEIRNLLKNSNITQNNIVSVGYDSHYPDKCYALTFSGDEATFIKLYEGYAYIEIDCQVGCQYNNGDVYFSPNEHHACVLSCDDIYLYDKIDKLFKSTDKKQDIRIVDNAICNKIFDGDFYIGAFDGKKAVSYGIDEDCREKIKNVMKNANFTFNGYDNTKSYPNIDESSKCYTLSLQIGEDIHSLKIYEGMAFGILDSHSVIDSENVAGSKVIVDCDDTCYDKIKSILQEFWASKYTGGEETKNVDEPKNAVTESSERTEIYDRLSSLSYEPYTCDGIPEYELEAPDGTKYQFNFSDKWVWRNGKEEAVLPDDLADTIMLEYIIYGEE